jgi:hypothetical protein
MKSIHTNQFQRDVEAFDPKEAAPTATAQPELSAEEILDNYEPNREYPMYYHQSDVIQAMEKYHEQFAATVQPEGRMYAPKDFLEYCTDERNAICDYINSLEWSTELRTKVESLLICFDQMKERLKPISPTEAQRGEGVESAEAIWEKHENIEREKYNGILFKENSTIIAAMKEFAAQPKAAISEEENFCERCGAELKEEGIYLICPNCED